METQGTTTTARVGEIARTAVEHVSEPPNQERIAALAYGFWRTRGCPDGTPLEDWFRAEREVAKSIGLREIEVESRHAVESVVEAEEVDSSLLRFPARSEVSRTANGLASRSA